jgi:hypothetical protein
VSSLQKEDLLLPIKPAPLLLFYTGADMPCPVMVRVRGDGTLYTLGGMYMMNTGNMAQATVTPNPDTIQEVRVLQNNYGVPYSVLNGIDPALGSGTFGQVISVADPRIAETALRYEF